MSLFTFRHKPGVQYIERLRTGHKRGESRFESTRFGKLLVSKRPIRFTQQGQRFLPLSKFKGFSSEWESRNKREDFTELISHDLSVGRKGTGIDI